VSESSQPGAEQAVPPGALGATVVASGAVVIAALVVQRDCIGEHAALIPWLWGSVGVLALIVWQWATRIVPPPPIPAPIDLPAVSHSRRRVFQFLLGVAVVALVSGVALLWRDLLSSAGAWLWFAGLSGLAVSVTVREAHAPRLRPQTASEWLWWGLAVVAVVGAFGLRLYRLDTIPPTFLQDEGSVGDWGLNYLHHTPVFGQHVATAITLFRNGVVACPLLGSFLHALVMQLAGETTFGLRLTAAVCGGLTVWVFYLIASTYLSRWAALAATLLLGVSHVHMHWSRLGMQQSMNTLVATLVVWFTLRGLRSPGYLSFVLGGLCLGTAQYLYEGARVLVPTLALFFAYMAVTDRQFLRQRAPHIAVMAATAMAVFAPFGIWFYQNTGALLGRSREVFVFAQPVYLDSRYPGLTATQVVLAQLRRSLLGFAYFGDGSGAFDELQVPLVDPVSGALVLAGILGFSLRPRRPVDALVALWIWVPIAITCTVTVDPPPLTRLIMMFPALFFVAGAMLDRLGWLLGQAARRARLADPTLALVVAGVSWAALWNCRSFFIDYPRAAPPNLWTEAGHLARAAGPTSKTYMVSPTHIYFYSPEMRFLARGLAGADVPMGGIPVQERGYRDGLFLVSPALPDAVERLRTSYPHGQLTEHRNRYNRLLFTAYRVDAAEMNATTPLDAPWQQYDLRFGMGGKAFGEFENPSGLAVGSNGSIYVADTGNGRIDVFNWDGKPVAALGRLGNGEREFRHLCAVAAGSDGSVLGLDCETHWIKRFSGSGRWLGNFGGPEQLTTPSGLAVAPDGSVVVADAGQQAILRFDPTGTLVTRAGASGDGRGQSVEPEAIAVSGDGTVYVVDSASARVRRYSAQLEHQLQWPLPRAQAGMAIAVADARGGAVYVTDPALGHIQRYTPDGGAEWTVGAEGNDPFKLLRPAAVATDGAGSVYVLDGGRNQVFRYDVTRTPR
jgi:DNA-binding beta-propeller fold protein YncE